MKIMNAVKRLIKSFFVSLGIVLLILGMSYINDFTFLNVSINKVADFYASNIKTSIHEFAMEVKQTPQVHSVQVIKKDNDFFLEIHFKYVTEDTLTNITVNTVTYTDYTYYYRDNQFVATFKIDVLFDEDSPSKNITLTRFTVKDDIIYTQQNIKVYKDIDPQLIALKKQSVVKLEIKGGSSFFPQVGFGSGVLFKKEISAKKGLLGEILYDYFILTNYHVVSHSIVNGQFLGDIKVHYGNYGNTYPKSYLDSTVLMGVYTEKTDLAIIKLTTADSNLVILEDDQFTTLTPATVTEGEPVFLIGSPHSTSLSTFNEISHGEILNVSSIVVLSDEPSLCVGGCPSIQTSAYLGQGSSGGGVFNGSGQLIGIHFAGNETYETSSELPMDFVLKAIKHILYNESAELNYLSSFFYKYKKGPNLVPLHLCFIS